MTCCITAVNSSTGLPAMHGWRRPIWLFHVAGTRATQVHLCVGGDNPELFAVVVRAAHVTACMPYALGRLHLVVHRDTCASLAFGLVALCPWQRRHQNDSARASPQY